MATTKLNLGNLPLRDNNNNASDTTESENTNQSVVLPGAFGKNNNSGQATNTQDESATIAPGAIKRFITPKETTASTYEAPLQNYPGLASSISNALSTPSFSKYSMESFNDYQHEFPTYNELQEALGPTYEVPANADIESKVPTAANPTDTPIDPLNKWNRTRNLLDATSVGSQRAWNVIQNQPKAEQTAVQNSLRNDTDIGLLGAEAVHQQWGRDNNVDAYNTYARLMAAGESPEYAAKVATEQYPINENSFGPFADAIQNEIKEKTSAAEGKKEAIANQAEEIYEDTLNNADSLSYMSKHGYAVGEEAALDEFCEARGLSYVEDNPSFPMIAFQVNGTEDEWRDFVKSYPAAYWSYDEFSYDSEGNPIAFEDLVYENPETGEMEVNDALMDACFNNFWNHYKPITIDQYFDFEDQAGNYTYNGTTTLDVYALCGSDLDVMQEWANCLSGNEWWNSEDLGELVEKYANDEPYDFSITSENGNDDLANLEMVNAQSWLTTLFANAQKESTLKANEANEYRNNPNSPWTIQDSGMRGINVNPSQITGEEGFNNSTYWINPDMLYLGGPEDDGSVSFATLGLSEVPDYSGTNYLYNPSDTNNSSWADVYGGSVTKDFDPVEWTGPEGATYSNYTMRNEGRAFAGLPYWTSEAATVQNQDNNRNIYSYTPGYIYPEAEANYPNYNPYAFRDNGYINTYNSSDQEE